MQTLLEKLYALRAQQSECPLWKRVEIQKKIIIILKAIDTMRLIQKLNNKAQPQKKRIYQTK